MSGLSFHDESTKRILNISLYSTIIITFLLPFVTVVLGLQTNFYRDIFFYADKYVVTEIIRSGHITPPHISQLAGSGLKQDNWGKIISRKKMPILPILIAEYSMVTDLRPNFFYTIFPGFLLIWLGYFILAKQVIVDRRIALAVAGMGALAPNIPVIYTQNITSLSNAIILVAVTTLIHIIKQNQNVKFGFSLLISLFLVVLFYWYPPKFALIGVLVFAVCVFRYLSNRRLSSGLLIPLVISGFLFLQIFEIPLNSYIYYIKLGIVKLVAMNLSLPTGGNNTPDPTVIKPSYYSVLSLLSLLPLGIIGGIFSLKSILLNKVKSSSFEWIAVLWGISILFVSLLYMASGKSFLVGRPFQLSVPVIIMGVILAVSKIENSNLYSFVAIILLISTVGSSFYLQSVDVRSEIQTYEPGSRQIGSWGQNYFEGIIFSDTMTGATVAGKGYLLVEQPDDRFDTWKLFYSSEASFVAYVKSKDASGVLLSNSMKKEGLFVNELPHRPIPRERYNDRLTSSNLVYSSGQYHYLSINH